MTQLVGRGLGVLVLSEPRLEPANLLVSLVEFRAEPLVLFLKYGHSALELPHYIYEILIK